MIKKYSDAISETDINIWLLLGSTWTIISRLHEIELAQSYLTPEQASILRIVQDNGNAATASFLEDVTMRQQNTISILINRMIKLGLLTKAKKPGKRKYQISLTKKGKSRLKKVRMKAINMIFSSLTAQEKRQLARCLLPLYQKVHNSLILGNMPPFLKDVIDKYTPDIWNPQDGLSDHKLWVLLDRTGFGIFRLMELEVTTFGLTMMQAMVLKILHDNNGLATYKILKDVTMRQRHSVSSLTNRMMKVGLVAKDKSPDGIQHTVSSTKKGEEMFDRVKLHSLKITISSLTDKQKQQLTRLLYSLNAKARDSLGV